MTTQQTQQQPGDATQNRQPPNVNQASDPDPNKRKDAADPGARTLYDDLNQDPPGKQGSTAWPEDWREQWAKELHPDDEEARGKSLKMLQRFEAPGKVAKSWFAVQQRVSSGEFKRAVPKDATPEAVKAWREENGIPVEPKDYVIPGFTPEEFDKLDDVTKSQIEIFRTDFHGLNLPQAHADAIVKTFHKVAEQAQVATAQRDAANQEALEDDLRARWGKDYRTNMIANLDVMTKALGEDHVMPFLNARMENGLRIADMPEFSLWINSIARAGGHDILVTGDMESGGKSVEAQIEEIKQIMRSDMGRYRAEGWDKKYEKLLAVQEARGKLK